MKLSIVIPFWNAEPYTSELLNVLEPQMRGGVECIVIDDGSPVPFKTDHKWVKVFRKENGGASTARNLGMDKATGEYISFIDSDDLVPNYFVDKLLKKIEDTHPDVIDFSWKSLNSEGTQHNVVLHTDDDWLTNPSVCTRAFRRAYIGDTRFNEEKDSTEDEDFSRRVGYLYHDGSFKHVSIKEYMYFYRTAVTDSKVKRFKAGLTNTKRIVYYFNHVTADMKWLLEEIKEENRIHEVYLFTNKCDIPEMKRYCRVVPPQRMWTHYLRGEPFDKCQIIPVATRVQVVVWIRKTVDISGINTFIYNFCKTMRNRYEILVLYNDMPQDLVTKLSAMVRTEKHDPRQEIVCEVLISNRIREPLPENVKYDRVIQMCHTCKIDSTYHIPQDRDTIVCVSNTAKSSFKKEAEDSIVIHNLAPVSDVKKAMVLVSATRLDSTEKGRERVIKLARLFEKKGIPYVWLCFTNVAMEKAPKGIVQLPPTLDIKPFIAMATYLVQLSSSESFCYSLVEALQVGTPVLTTPLDVLPEIGVKDGVNGYIIPFDFDDTLDVDKIYNKPPTGFLYDYDNKSIERQWELLIGDLKKVKRNTTNPRPTVRVKVLMKYTDIILNAQLMPNQEVYMTRDRAHYLKHKGFIEILDTI